ncbi:DUF2147 domain-containing protein [Rhizobium mongolense]|uniref:DUF2147 domain-containing protein n=1 Tax=Rhizobium mongolense TaxID=57676 RepID=UPI0034A2619A
MSTSTRNREARELPSQHLDELLTARRVQPQRHGDDRNAYLETVCRFHTHYRSGTHVIHSMGGRFFACWLVAERRRRQRQAEGLDPNYGVKWHPAGQGRKVFLGPNESGTCVKCEGALKNAPVTGMVILSGLKKDGDEYTGGKILDPDSGKIYSSKISLTNGGKKLNVRGFVGVSMLGRSQVRERQD